MTTDATDTARRLLLDGEVAAAVALLEKIERGAASDALQLQQVAEVYLHCGQHGPALRCYRRSAELEPKDPEILYNLASSLTAHGEIEQAERLYDRVIELDPGDMGAWLNRSLLRRQTAESNHVEQLDFVLAHLSEDDPGRVPVLFALARELEDLGRYDRAFACLQQGAHLRRLGMRYDIEEDEQAMRAVERRFDAGLFRQADTGFESDRPVFILGLPRSGTTLVDRILSSHSAVGSLGEHNTLALALVKAAGGSENRRELIARSAEVDFRRLGSAYCESIDGFGDPSPRLTDKTPLNFLYIGLIRLALPRARIIHLRRNAMDVCYAIYKTLFRAGYPFSYSLQETGRYYLAYHRLMAHWRRTIPDAFLDVDYERLVTDTEGQARRMLDYLDLDWEDGCLDFHQRPGAAATASAAQVRQPVYSSSVGLWRRYEKQLAPFAARLREHGIDVDLPA